MGKLAQDLQALGMMQHYAWAPAPASGDYGVWSEDGVNDFEADGVHAERAVTGTIDLFCRSDASTSPAAVESVLRSQPCCAWSLNSIQFEEETGLIHYEWIYNVVEA